MIAATGRRAIALAADATDPCSVGRVAQAALTQFGRVDIWVNHAGGQPDGQTRAIIDLDEANFRAQVDLNFGSVWASSVAAARIRGDGGSIVNIGSIAARRGRHAHYGLSAALKAAAGSLTTTLAAELAPRIRVDAVAPSAITTERFARPWASQKQRRTACYRR